jgi:hypothetical protein
MTPRQSLPPGLADAGTEARGGVSRGRSSRRADRPAVHGLYQQALCGQFPGDITIIEVSQEGDDSPADLQKFQDDLATPLIKVGIRPSAWSKTESGSSCQ